MAPRSDDDACAARMERNAIRAVKLRLHAGSKLVLSRSAQACGPRS